MATEERIKDSIVEQANTIILCMDKNGNITYLNGFALSFFGYSHEEVIGRHITETILPKKESTGRDLAEMIENICRQPDRFSINENENRKKDGSLVWVLWSNKPILNEKKEIIGILCIGNDITRRRNIEMAIKNDYKRLVKKFREKEKDRLFEVVDKNVANIELYESEARYRNIVECAVEGIFQVTEDGKLIMANRSLAEMLGYSSPEEMRSTIREFGRQFYVEDADRQRLEALLREKGYVKNFETRFLRKDGQEIWVNMNLRTVPDFIGRILCFEGTIEDITDRKNKEVILRESYEKLQRAMDGIITALSTTVELRDPYTAGHQKRVTELAVAIAKNMHYNDDMIKFLSIAGVLHDIGKLCVPAEILSKPGRISKKEFSILKDHPDEGYRILENINFEYPVAEIIREHHERMDGSGYPRGLKGDEILMDARIIGVADVVESMASHRPYRPSLGMDIALDEIEKNRGVLYDADVVEACRKAIREQGFRFDQ